MKPKGQPGRLINQDATCDCDDDGPRGPPQNYALAQSLGSLDRLPDLNRRLYPVQRLANLVEILVEEGVRAAEVLSGSELTPADFRSASTRISLRQLTTVYNNAIRLSKDPKLGFRLGKRTHITSLGMYGYALLSCQNADEAAKFGAKYIMTAGPSWGFTYSSDSDWAHWVFFPVISQDPLSDLYRFSLEATFAGFNTVSHDLHDGPTRPSCVRIVYPPPPHASVYSDGFQCPVFFNSDVNEILTPVAEMAKPIACASPINLEFARLACEDILKEIEISGGYASLVRRALLRVPGRLPSAKTIAAELGLSLRQLHRNLQTENMSYRKILDEARTGLAMAYLRKTPLSTEDIAIRLGFSDGANFRHAFRRWTGKTTSDFRTRHENAGARSSAMERSE